jgi:GntR family transcriptional regulator
LKEFNNNISIYVQIMDEIKRWIISGKLEKGAQLPTVRDLAVEFQVNVNTIQRMYLELEGEGIVYSKRGIGRFVTENQATIQYLKITVSQTVIEEMKSLGFQDDEIIGLIQKREKEKNS